MSNNIYELPKEIENALEQYYDCFDDDWVLLVTEEYFNDTQKILFDLQNQKQELMEWYLKDRQNKLANNIWLQTEIIRLQTRIEQNNKKIERVEKLIDFTYKQDYKKPINIWNYTIQYNKSSACIITNEDLISDIYKKSVTKTTISVDKKAITKAIEDWIKVEWAEIENRLNLKIK